MSIHQNGPQNEHHRQAAELHDQAAHAHLAAAETHGKQDHQTGAEQSRQALEHSNTAYLHEGLSLQRAVVHDHGATLLLDHQDIAALAYLLWQDRGRPYGSPERDWFQATRELRSRADAL